MLIANNLIDESPESVHTENNFRDPTYTNMHTHGLHDAPGAYNQSDLEKETSSKSRFDVDNENGAKHLFNANELAKKNVLESSSSDDNDDEDDDDDDQEADAKSKKETKNGEMK